MITYVSDIWMLILVNILSFKSQVNLTLLRKVGNYMNITSEMVIELNNELEIKGCPFRYKYEGVTEFSHIPSMAVTLPNMNCVGSCIINVTSEFLEWLELWFETKYGIELKRNTNGSILWSKNGWTDDLPEEIHGYINFNAER